MHGVVLHLLPLALILCDWHRTKIRHMELLSCFVLFVSGNKPPTERRHVNKWPVNILENVLYRKDEDHTNALRT